ncbi:hypothetical protein GXB81_22220 [Paraburkholderia sp. Ac-20336]|uniref:hypothetical protein n=1 Tax=Burkholderiaceae TaxID=119060 RepID=UPI00142338DF|nr:MULTISPECIES: hypothetical protein [Burkholderiaceae]MBN3805747.1 hypothetical protein [Paraburkholderia sp. Ac-20336]MBN3850462.1 hypothetical protein [Paraburkholderia sp. Ac-20342]NIF52226.1 hypothetical protein [Burkholderia sp. Ax-1724]
MRVSGGLFLRFLDHDSGLSQQRIDTREDGKRRRLAFIGDKAYCPACDSFGQITYGAGVSDRHRLIDNVNGGRRQAVGGDIVLCKCANRPRIIAIYGTSWRITDRGDEDTTRGPIAPAAAVNHWISFTLTELGNFDGLRCVAHFADGSSEYGTFDASNVVRFERADNGNACTRIKLLPRDSAGASGSVTESIPSAIAR